MQEMGLTQKEVGKEVVGRVREYLRRKCKKKARTINKSTKKPIAASTRQILGSK